jgi:hypothetical protein
MERRLEVYLPRAGAPVEARPPASVADAPGGRETTLLVEDDSAVRRAAIRVLGDKGCQE